MRSGLTLAAIAALTLLSACASTGSGSGGGDGSMIKMYVDGQIKASPLVSIHDNVSTGQMWETTTSYGSEVKQTWQVSKMTGRGEFILEHNTGQGHILAYRVNTWADAGQPNVLEAWIGKKGEEPKKIQVMEWKTGEAGTPAETTASVTREPFTEVPMGGKKFEGELVTTSDKGNTTKMWVASNGWFDRVIRMDMNEKTVMELSKAHFDEKARTLLMWEKPKEK